MEVSFTTLDALAPPAVTVNVSAPSVKLSFSKVTVIVATPFELTTAVPLKPPETSASETPESVYGTEVPDARFLVVSVNEAALPSFTE